MPSEFVFEPRSPRYGPFLVSGCWCTLRGFWGFLAHFWAVSRTYRGFRGHQRSLGCEKVKPHVECSSRLPSFGCLAPLLGLFWAKNGCFWPKTAQIWEGTSRLGATARAATGEFLAQNLDLARPPPRLQDGYMGKRSEALGQSNGQNGMETCCCCCLLLLLLAKFKGRGCSNIYILQSTPLSQL